MHEHAQHSRAAVRKGSGFFQCPDRFVELLGADKRKSKEPQSHWILRFHGQRSAQFPNGLIVAVSLKEDPGDLSGVKSLRVEFLRPSRPVQRLVSSALAQ